MVKDQPEPASRTRRRLLGLIAVSIGIGLGLRVPRTRNPRFDWLEVARRFGLDELDMDAIGNRYLSDRPDEATAGVLEARLPAASRYAALERARQSDFASGRLVIVDRWILSLTEARVAARVVQTSPK